MMNSARTLGSTAGISTVLVALFAGCAQVLDIQDWEQSSSGQGGQGGQSSASSATGGQTSAVSSSAASSSTASSSAASFSAVSSSAASSSAGTGGQGGNTSTCPGTCTVPVPPDWGGPVAIFVGDKNTALPSCGPGWSNYTDWSTGTLIAPDAQCGACSCSPAMGGSCYLTQVHIDVFDDSTCAGNAVATTPLTVPNTCTAINLGTASIPFTAQLDGQSLPAGGGCFPSGGAATKPPAYFDQHARICIDPAVDMGCTDGDLCAPTPPPPFHPALCIFRPVPDGVTVNCPPGYDNPLPYLYSGFMDTRGCTNCQGCMSQLPWTNFPDKPA